MLRFRCLSHNFLKQGDFEDIFVNRILHFVQGAGLFVHVLKCCTEVL
jgi:hypothetical protein